MIKAFFLTLGVIFFILIIAGAVFFITDPYNIRPIISIIYESVTADSATVGTSERVDKNPLLEVDQEKILESMGINPASLPSEITPEMESCFTKTLGSQRVNEIKAGSSPTASDFFTARECL